MSEPDTVLLGCQTELNSGQESRIKQIEAAHLKRGKDPKKYPAAAHLWHEFDDLLRASHVLKRTIAERDAKLATPEQTYPNVPVPLTAAALQEKDPEQQ